MSSAKQLYELQETDLDIEHKIEALTQIRNQLGKDDELVAARAALDTMRKRLADLEHQQRTTEWGVDDLGAKLALMEKKLYGGSVRNPRELVSLQQEAEHLKAQRREREEHLLAIMVEVETAQQDVHLRSSELEGMERDWREDQQQLLREQTELEANLATLEQKRGLLLQQTDSASLKLYEELRQAKQGQAVAKLQQGRCQGCRISLPMSDQQRARMGHELVKCSNCGRILYVS